MKIFVNSIILIIFLYETAVSQKELDSCVFPTGEKGQCKLFFECQRQTTNSSMSVSVCSWREITPIVCCLDEIKPVNDTVSFPNFPLGKDRSFGMNPFYISKLRKLMKFLQKLGFKTKPMKCIKIGLGEIIKFATKEMKGGALMHKAFGTRKDRIARFRPEKSLSKEEFLKLNADYKKPEFQSDSSSMTNVIGSIDGYFYPIYYLNWTREYLIDLGYTVEVVSKYYDAIDELSFWNVTFCGRVSFDYVILDRSFTTRITGGMPASRIRARYMALIGEKKKGENPYWGCDGVLINYNWVLSAAHCFVIMGFNPNVVRLGEYNLAEEIKDQYSNFPEDFDIFKLVFHPKFDVRRRYYDLALFCLGRYVPQLSNSISPIQLPWNFTETNFVGEVVTLTGWGSTMYLGSTKSEILREVNLTVFHSAFCDVFYSNLRDYHIKWPRGISEDKLLCVGDSNGMKDACQGDSGAPLTLTVNGRFILIAIVSNGYGCGLQNYPGLYTPVYTNENIDWIKKTAFKRNFHGI